MTIVSASGPGAPSTPVAQDSLKKRYAYKLGLNIASLPFTLGTQALVARLLGPSAFGSYTFLNNFFTQVVGFCDSGLSSGFYNKLSQRPGEHGLIRFFWGVAVIVTVIVLCLVGGVMALGGRKTLWPDQQSLFVWLAAGWALMTWYSVTINRAVDAYGLTIPGEVARLQQKVLAFLLVLLLVLAGWGGLTQFYASQYVVLAFACLAWAAVIRRHGHSFLPMEKLGRRRVADYSREFYSYSSPLLVLGVASLIGGVLDRWFLQRYAGSAQQGLFGLSAQIGAVCFMVSSPMTTLFWREIARASAANDLEQMRHLFRRTVMVLYVVTAFLAVFIAFQAENVITLLGGAAFSAGATAVAIMAFYPIHQTYGQLTGSVLLATGRTHLSKNLGMLTMAFGLMLSWFLLAPPARGGLGLGASGLASKLVLEQFVGVNVQLWFVTRLLKISFVNFLFHQLYSVAAMVSIAAVSSFVARGVTAGALASILSSGVVYTVGVAALLFLFPQLVCTSREELLSRLPALRTRIVDALARVRRSQ